jgi:hypothetical protein
VGVVEGRNCVPCRMAVGLDSSPGPLHLVSLLPVQISGLCCPQQGTLWVKSQESVSSKLLQCFSYGAGDRPRVSCLRGKCSALSCTLTPCSSGCLCTQPSCPQHFRLRLCQTNGLPLLASIPPESQTLYSFPLTS